uniref:Calcineurin-like phosphoesterase domain-containing protein n=1 Tax=Arcella intermedia TaxID=1963864 RepID=A0A6B2L7Y6_9EUKA
MFSQEYHFNTRQYGTFPFTMVTFADFKISEEVTKQKQVIKRLVRNLAQFDIILEFGDICYADGNQAVWDSFFNHIQPIAACKPWMVTVGNHEKEPVHEFLAFENRFKMPGSNNFWYGFNYGFAHFLVISTEHTLAPGSPQYEFIIADLEKAQANRDVVPWIILTGHRALYGSNARWFHKAKAETMRQILTPIIDKYGVDLALFGHCHAYERTHPMYAGEIDPRGTIYLLAGVAGAELDKIWEVQPQWSAYRTAHHGYGLLHVKSKKKLRYCYHRERDGKMWDAFTLIKRENNKKKVSYDYENKFLKNWITLGESEARAERKRNKDATKQDNQT